MFCLPRLLLRITLPLVLMLLPYTLPAASGQKLGQALPAKFEAQINENLAGKQVREAILAVAQYEDAVRACYPVPVYHKGVLLSEADHLRMVCPYLRRPGGTRDRGQTL